MQGSRILDFWLRGRILRIRRFGVVLGVVGLKDFVFEV